MAVFCREPVVVSSEVEANSAARATFIPEEIVLRVVPSQLVRSQRAVTRIHSLARPARPNSVFHVIFLHLRCRYVVVIVLATWWINFSTIFVTPVDIAAVCSFALGALSSACVLRGLLTECTSWSVNHCITCTHTLAIKLLIPPRRWPPADFLPALRDRRLLPHAQCHRERPVGTVAAFTA